MSAEIMFHVARTHSHTTRSGSRLIVPDFVCLWSAVGIQLTTDASHRLQSNSFMNTSKGCSTDVSPPGMTAMTVLNSTNRCHTVSTKWHTRQQNSVNGRGPASFWTHEQYSIRHTKATVLLSLASTPPSCGPKMGEQQPDFHAPQHAWSLWVYTHTYNLHVSPSSRLQQTSENKTQLCISCLATVHPSPFQACHATGPTLLLLPYLSPPAPSPLWCAMRYSHGPKNLWRYSWLTSPSVTCQRQGALYTSGNKITYTGVHNLRVCLLHG